MLDMVHFPKSFPNAYLAQLTIIDDLGHLTMSGTDNHLLPIARSFIQEQLEQVNDDDQTNWTNVYETAVN